MITLFTIYLIVGIGLSTILLDEVIASLIEFDPKHYTDNFLLRLCVVSTITFMWPAIFIYGEMTK